MPAGSSPCAKETLTEFSVPSFGLAQSWLVWTFGRVNQQKGVYGGAFLVIVSLISKNLKECRKLEVNDVILMYPPFFLK